MSNGNCSFCGKRHDEVFRLISADGAKICSECVGRCADIIAQEYKSVIKDISFPPRSDDNGAEE